MGGRSTGPGTTPAGRFIRGRQFDHNPLRRAADRAETRVLILLVAAFLVAAPLTALASGAWAHAMAQRAELAQAASRRQVTAVILTVPGDSSVGAWNMTAVTQARWTAPDGKVVTGELPVDAGTEAGTTVRIWTTRDGQLSSHPLSESQVAALTDLVQAAGAAAVALVLALAGVMVRWSLDRRRLVAWDAAWQVTGPRWTTRA
jgi:hypothetical protein